MQRLWAYLAREGLEMKKLGRIMPQVIQSLRKKKNSCSYEYNSNIEYDNQLKSYIKFFNYQNSRTLSYTPVYVKNIRFSSTIKVRGSRYDSVFNRSSSMILVYGGGKLNCPICSYVLL